MSGKGKEGGLDFLFCTCRGHALCCGTNCFDFLVLFGFGGQPLWTRTLFGVLFLCLCVNLGGRHGPDSSDGSF